MAYADRGTLADRIAGRQAAGQPMPLEEAVADIAGISEGLAIAHAAGIVHRDLKPSNVLFRSVRGGADGAWRESLCLADFGVARQIGMETSLVVAGTVAFMAPEQADFRRAGSVDSRADIYSAALIFCELVAGRLPQPNERVADLAPHLPAGIAPIVEWALAPEPSARPATATEWASHLAAAAFPRAAPRIERGADHSRAEAEPEARPPKPRNRTPVIAAVAAAVVIVVLLAIVLLRPSGGGGGGSGSASESGPTSTVAVIEHDPLAPTDLKADDKGAQAELTWRDPNGGRSDYVIFQRASGGDLSAVGSVDAGGTRYVASGLDPTVGYCFWVVVPVANASLLPSAPACIRGAEQGATPGS
jgi:hypothetical protein